MINKITRVQKRDETIVEFDQIRISEAVFKALTATGQGDGKRAKKLSDRVIQILNRRFKKDEIPHVEQIQDIVEEVLILEGLVEAAKAYILYREQRRRIREAVRATEEAVERVDQYLEQLDWEVKENANMAFSLQGLNHYATSHVIRKYWLNKIYPKEIREAHESGDLHLDKLDTLGVYCSGWDLYDLLLKGFGGVPGKLDSKPPKHLEAALGQAVNFIFTLAGEVAGAVSFSNFDTLLAPFIRYDNLTYKEIKQALQEFLFNMATPTRVGFQCLSEDTEILTPEGWRNYDEIKVGDEIKTLNLETQKIEPQKVNFVFKRDYQGIMYHLKGKKVDQLISPRHQVVRKIENNSYQTQPIEEILKLNPSVSLPFISQKDQIGVENFPIKEIKKIKYKGIIWCPRTENGTIIARRKGKVFITGNCPFSNITLDLKPSPVFAKLPVIIGGQPQKETYGEFEEEMKIFDKALYEVWFEGDKNMRTFSFPIPTINITKDFPWEDPAFDGIFEASAKYGINYFGNYISSDMKPEDVRSMCLDGKEEILIRNSKKIRRFPIKEIAESYKAGSFDKEGWADCKKEGNLEVLSLNPQTLKLEWSPIKRFLKIVDTRAIEIITEDGRKALYSLKHPIPIYTSEGIKMKFTRDVKVGEKILATNSIKKLEKSPNLKDEKIKPISITSVKIKKYKKLKEFYDLELERNHLFVHSLGQISFNCCRLRLNLTELYNRGGGGLFGSGANTGSVSVISVNLPRIGYLSKTKKEFFERLAKVMDLAKEVLEIKRKVLENLIEKGLYPYSKVYLDGVKKMRGVYYANHFSTIGLVGLNETLLNFLGENIASRRGRRFALEVLDFMRERLVRYQKETGNIYNLEATPAESTAYRLALKDKAKYPDIITAGTKKVPFYTNSSQLPVNFTDDIFEALKLQDELQCRYNGGTVFHLFLGERISDIQTVKSLIKKIFENFKLPYITFTPIYSICPSHGYLEGEHFECPKCTIKQPCEVYSRPVGYYRPVSQYNLGKQQEFKQRKMFKIPKL